MNQLVFVIGMPRSGTKLLRDLLNRHPAIGIPGVETQFWPSFIKKYAVKDLDSYEVKKSIFADFRRTSFVRYAGCKVEEERFLSGTIKQYTDLFEALICPYIDKDAEIVGDKTPSYLFAVDELNKVFEGAKYIHIVRDPRDCALSARKTWGKNISRVAAQWQAGMNYISSLIQSNILSEKNYYELRYEDLITDPSGTLQGVCHYLGVGFVNEMTSLTQPSENYGDARGMKSIVSTNSNKFLTELSEKEVTRLEEICFYGLNSMQYKVYYSGSYKTAGRLDYLYWYFQDMIAIVIFRLRTDGLRGIVTQWILFKQRLSLRLFDR